MKPVTLARAAAPLVLLLLALAAPAALGATSMCRTPPKGASLAEPPVMVWGQETLVAFGSGVRAVQGAKPGVEGPWLAPVITAVVLFLIAGHLLLTAPPNAPLLYYTVVFYPFATALVELARINFDASRYGFLTATWHNLPEYILLCHLLLTTERAQKAFPRVLLWVWFLDVFIMFVPSLDGVHRGPLFGGLVEQLTGICCDHLLVWVFGYAWYNESDPALKQAYKLGFIGALMHMLEIVPLVVLLSGLVDRPFIPICVLVAFTTPITFYFYSLFAKQWVGEAARPAAAKQAIKTQHAVRLLAVGILLGLSTILGPNLLIPSCPPAGGSIAAPAALPSSKAPTCTDASLSRPLPPPLMCPSDVRLVGTTTIVPKPGSETSLLSMVSRMPGPIRLEPGNVFYEESFGFDSTMNRTVIKFFESWSSIATLYQHIYTSPTVNSVFRTPEFRAMLESQQLQGPFQALIPCDDARAEGKPHTLSFETTFEAPIDCVWAKIDAWCSDVDWVLGAKGVTCPQKGNAFLRTVHFNATDLLEIRQAPPLQPPEQPAGGHRLVYYLLQGGYLNLGLAVYKGDVTLLPHPADPLKTVFRYQSTLIASDAADTQRLAGIVEHEFGSRLPKLVEWSKTLSCSAPPPTEPAAVAPASSVPNVTTSAPPAGVREFYMMFQLDDATRSQLPAEASEVLQFLLNGKGRQPGAFAEAIFAGNVGSRILHQKYNTIPQPGCSGDKHWDLILMARLGPSLSPDDVAPQALQRFVLEVRSKPLLSPADVARCSNSPELDAAIEAVRPEVENRTSHECGAATLPC